jgi:HK97 family phage major capsid protein
MEKEIKNIEEELEEDEQDDVIEDIKKSIKEMISEEVEGVKTYLDEEVKKFAPKSEKTKTLVEDEAFVKALQDISGKKKTNAEVNVMVKTAADMSLVSNLDGTVTITDIDTEVSRDPQRQPFIEQLVSVGTIDGMYDLWVETVDETGDPLPKAELAELPQKDYEFEEFTAKVEKIGVYSKYSAEMAADASNLVNEVRNFLLADLREKVDSQILTGDGQSNDLKGIIHTDHYTAYSAGDFADTVSAPNRFDVIETAANQVVVGLHTPNYVVLHPTDVSKMRLSKGDDDHYVMPPFSTQNGMNISGLRVIANTGITAGNFLVGDFTKSSVKYRQGITLAITNTDEDDFQRDRFTVRALVRLVHRVRGNDKGAFVYGNFDTAIAALTDES